MTGDLNSWEPGLRSAWEQPLYLISDSCQAGVYPAKTPFRIIV